MLFSNMAPLLACSYPIEQLPFSHAVSAAGVNMMTDVVRSCSFVYRWKAVLCSEPPTLPYTMFAPSRVPLVQLHYAPTFC